VYFSRKILQLLNYCKFFIKQLWLFFLFLRCRISACNATRGNTLRCFPSSSLGMQIWKLQLPVSRSWSLGASKISDLSLFQQVFLANLQAYAKRHLTKHRRALQWRWRHLSYPRPPVTSNPSIGKYSTPFEKEGGEIYLIISGCLGMVCNQLLTSRIFSSLIKPVAVKKRILFFI